MKSRRSKELVEKAWELRKMPTGAERLLWGFLRNRRLCGIKFRRQHIIGPFIVDFYSHEEQLVIEIDGGQHGENDEMLCDAKRTASLEDRGLRVLRFWNNEVLCETEAVLESIRRACAERPRPGPDSHPT